MWRRRADVLWRAAPDYLVISTIDGQVVEFGGPAGEIWKLLEEPQRLDELSAELAGHFTAAPEMVRHDVEAFVAELRQRSLVEQVEQEDRT